MNPAILAYAQKNKIPITAVNSRPEYSESKQRITKGKSGFVNKDWQKAIDLNMEHVNCVKEFGVFQPTMWYLLIEKANLFVIDVDIVGDMTGQEALTEQAYTYLFERSNYVVQTGSGGLHFYFQKGDCDFEFKKKTTVKELQKWFKPDVKGEIDIITQFIVMEGSSYEFQGKKYEYKSIKPGCSIQTTTFDIDVWDDIQAIYCDAKPKNVIVNPDEEEEIDLSAVQATPLTKKADTVYQKDQNELRTLLGLLSVERADGYDSWSKVGFSIKQHCGSTPLGLEAFKEFSKKSYKYKEWECEKWYNALELKQSGYTIASLHYWAKLDNLTGYKDAFNLNMTWDKLIYLNQNELADIYTANVEQDYVYSQEQWFHYRANNLVEKLGKAHPDGLKKNISCVLQEELDALKNTLKRDDENYSDRLKLVIACHKSFGSSQFINGVLDFVRPNWTDDEFADKVDMDLNLLAFTNGVLDLKAKVFRPLTKEDCCSKNTKYAFQATSNPEVRAFLLNELKGIFNTDEVVKWFLETQAMGLFGNKWELFHIHTGSGGNGKGLLFTLLMYAIGEYYYQAPNEFLTTTYKADAPNSTLANAKGVRAFVVSEPSSQGTDGRGIKLSTDLIKALCGGDPINARDLYKTAKKTWLATFTAWLQCNAIPEMTKVDKAIRRRNRNTVYPNKFVEKPDPKRSNQKPVNYELKDVFKQFEYYSEFMLLLWETARDFTKLTTPETVMKDTKKHLDNADKVLGWLEDKCEKWSQEEADDWKKVVPVADRFTKGQAYKRFIADTEARMTAQAFHQQMATNEVGEKKIGSEYYFLRVKTDEELGEEQKEAEEE